MKKIKLDISYIGDAYCGWQVQPNALSVQQRLQDALEALYGKRVPVTGCSRTDSGVHARSFICSAQLDDGVNNIPVERLPQAAAAFLPDDISIKSAVEVPEDFHPRYDALGKEYEYVIQDGNTPDPFLYKRAWFCPGRLDEERMAYAASFIEGHHDFRAFMASGSKIEDTRRTVYYCKVKRENGVVKINVCADGFLYNMVRIIAGTLVDVGYARKSPEELESIIASKDRSNAGSTAPAHALYLKKVFYEKGEISNEAGK